MYIYIIYAYIYIYTYIYIYINIYIYRKSRRDMRYTGGFDGEKEKKLERNTCCTALLCVCMCAGLGSAIKCFSSHQTHLLVYVCMYVGMYAGMHYVSVCVCICIYKQTQV